MSEKAREQAATVLIHRYPMIRLGIRAILDQGQLFRVVAETAEPDEGFELVESSRPEMVILGMQFPGHTGFARAARSESAMAKPARAGLLRCSDARLPGAMPAGRREWVCRDERADSKFCASDRQDSAGPNLSERRALDSRAIAPDTSRREHATLSSREAQRERIGRADLHLQGDVEWGDRASVAPEREDGRDLPKPNQTQSWRRQRDRPGTICDDAL